MRKQTPISELIVDMYSSEILETTDVPMPKKKRGMIPDIRIISKFMAIGSQEIIIDADKDALTCLGKININEPMPEEIEL